MKFVFIAVLLLSLNGWANVVTLKEVNPSQSAEGFTTEFLFDQNVDSSQATVDFINETIQVNLSNAKVAKSKINTKVDSDKVKSIYTYALDSNNSRARIILNKGLLASNYQDRVSIKTEGNKLTVTLATTPVIGTPVEPVAAVSDEDLNQATQWIAESESLQKAVDDKKKIENLKESEIPVLATAKEATKEVSGPSTKRILVSFGIVIALLAGASVFFKKFLKKTPLNKNSQIKVLTQYYLGPRKSLAIVRVAGESVLIGVTDSNISLIKTLALLDEEIPTETPDTFESSFASKLNANANNENANASKNSDEASEEFSFSKVKDFVSGRLKNMKEL